MYNVSYNHKEKSLSLLRVLSVGGSICLQFPRPTSTLSLPNSTFSAPPENYSPFSSPPENYSPFISSPPENYSPFFSSPPENYSSFFSSPAENYSPFFSSPPENYYSSFFSSSPENYSSFFSSPLENYSLPNSPALLSFLFVARQLRGRCATFTWGVARQSRGALRGCHVSVVRPLCDSTP